MGQLDERWSKKHGVQFVYVDKNSRFHTMLFVSASEDRIYKKLRKMQAVAILKVGSETIGKEDKLQDIVNDNLYDVTNGTNPMGFTQALADYISQIKK